MLAQYVILGLLKERPMHGYEIKQRFERISGVFWKVSYGSLYPALRKLSEFGYIHQQPMNSEKTDGRKVYHLTDQGEHALLQWLSDTKSVEDLNRNTTNEFMLRLLFFGYLPKERVREIISIRLLSVENKLQELVDKMERIHKKSDRGNYFGLAVLDYIGRNLQTEKRWLEDILAEKEMPVASRPLTL